MSRLLPILLLAATALDLPAQGGPRVVTPTSAPPNPANYKRIAYPWRKNITATVFWVGEAPSGRNKTPNNKSSWDQEWQKNFGGYDNPDPGARANFRPRGFMPGQNTFYVALPYNDCVNHKAHKPEAARVIPWFKRYNPEPGDSVCKGRWVQIVYGRKYCFAQWEDCGPWVTDDWQYVFGNRPPRNGQNGGAGIDISPAVRDYLGVKSGHKVHWRFIEFSRIPRGPWAAYGSNNPFVNPMANPDRLAAQRYSDYLRRMRDAAYRRKELGN